MKRYGMAAVVTEQRERFVIRMDFPSRAPIHIMTYQSGLPETLPDYTYETSLSEDKTKYTVSALLTDAHFKKLTGKINSFPDRFRRVFSFTEPVEIVREVYRAKVLTVELKKCGEEQKAA